MSCSRICWRWWRSINIKTNTFKKLVSDMKVVRTFHPIGQGAFYSERFYEEGKPQAKINIVYDCGTSWGSITKAKNVVSQAFDKNDTIDYLFISHLDYDHVSLVTTLIDSVKRVKNIVLPLVDEEEIIIGIGLNKIANHPDTVEFLSLILDFIHGGNNSNLETEVTFVGGDGDRVVGRVSSMASGREISFVNKVGVREWVFIPRNISAESRRLELVKGLEKVLVDFGIKESGEDFLKRLLNEEYVVSVLKDAKFRKAIKSAYEKVSGGVNVNSLLLYSGPAEESDSFVMRKVLPDMRGWKIGYRAGCLYTGDSDCDIPEWQKSLYPNVWDRIDTIQLPHHGSLKSFDIENNGIDRRFFFPVSCGCANTYGHPSGKVLSYLISCDCWPQIVTEMTNTMYVQQIYLHH